MPGNVHLSPLQGISTHLPQPYICRLQYYETQKEAYTLAKDQEVFQ